MNYSMIDEVWKDVLGFEGHYSISNLGRIYSHKYRIIRKTHLTKGYMVVTLSADGKKRNTSVHRLVAEAFIPNPEGKPEVNHLDEHKTNNVVTNLEWVTSKENANYGSRNKKISDYVKANPVAISKGCIRNNVMEERKVVMLEAETRKELKVFDSVMQASRQMKIHQPNISSCCNGKKKTAGGYAWKHLTSFDQRH